MYGDYEVNDAMHDEEWSVEAQLPFIQMVAPGARIVPVLVGSSLTPQQANAKAPRRPPRHATPRPAYYNSTPLSLLCLECFVGRLPLWRTTGSITTYYYSTLMRCGWPWSWLLSPA